MRAATWGDLRPGDWLTGPGYSSQLESVLILSTVRPHVRAVAIDYLWQSRDETRRVSLTTSPHEELWSDWRVVSGRILRDRAGS